MLVMGERYGYQQAAGLSATHEEYREARGNRPVLLFVEEGVTMEPNQAEFLAEVRGWDTGHFYKSFSSAADLAAKVTRALHDYELSSAAGPIDETEMLERANAAIPQRKGWSHTELSIAVAGGPRQQVIRPAELDPNRLGGRVHQEAFFGDHAFLDRTAATEVAVRNGKLVVAQQHASVEIDELGTIRISVPATTSDRSSRHGLPALVEEDVQETIAQALRFAGWLLDQVDPVGRVSDVVPMVALSGGGYLAWRTRREHAASPNAGQMGGGTENVKVTLTPLRRHRAALTLETEKLVEDLTVLLRREVKR